MQKPATERLLIVDDDEAVRTALRKSLQAHGFQIVEAADGLRAKELLANDNQFSAIVSDIRMPNMDGVQLVKHVKSVYKIPMILITGFSEILETHDAFELGADDFIAKPFKVNEIVSSIRRLIKKSQQLEHSATDFCELSIDDFITGRQINFDIYIRLAGIKYVKIARRGENIDVRRIKIYKAKGIRSLWMHGADFAKYLGLNLNLLEVVDNRDRVDDSKKLNLIKHTGEIFMETLRFDGVDEENFERGQAFVQSIVSILSQELELENLLHLLQDHSDVLYIHSVAVALYSEMTARKVGWNSPVTLSKVTMGALLHDIGEKEIDRNILLKPRSQKSLNEVKIYESHSTRGLEILRSVASIPREVLQIVQQHHETCSGTGYPSNLLKEKIFPPARLICVVDEFCNLVLNRATDRRLAPIDALAFMEETGVGVYDMTFLNALKSLFPVSKESAA